MYRAIVTSEILNEGVAAPAPEYIQRLGRVLRKRGNAEAILYEVIDRKTVDENIACRRQPR